MITVTHGGYVKRTPLNTFRAQNRGGKGKAGMSTKEEDAVTRVFSASTHTPMLFFSSGGKVYKLKVWRLPIGAATARGKAFINLFPIELGETMTSILPLPEDEAAWEGMDVMFATRSGGVRRNRLSDFVQVNKNGKIAMKLDEGDAIIGVALCQSSGRRAADQRARPLHPLPGGRRARLRRPRIGRRARHTPRRRRRSDLDGHPARCRSDA